MRYRKSAAALLLLLLLISLLAFPASADAAHSVTVCDGAALLSESDIAALGSIGGVHGIRLYFVSGYSRFTADAVARICGIGSDDNAVVLAVDHAGYAGAEYFYEMFTFGKATGLLSGRRCDAILDAAEPYIKSGRVGEGAEQFFLRTVSEIEGVWRPLWLNVLITGLIVGVLACGGTVLGVFLYYRKKQRGASYPLDRYARLNLTLANDRFIGSTVTRVRVQSASSSGGGSRSSGGSSRGRR